MRAFQHSLVRDVMHPGVTTTSPNTPLRDAARQMGDGDLTCLVVELADRTRGFGILTQKDLVSVMADVGSFDGLVVADFMTHPTICLDPEWNLTTALALMRMMGLRRAPVVADGALLGILSFTDLFRHGLAGLSGEDA
ncbi:MAG: CBS domain-containing protein [Planctomycetes bacterium]|nr:CBS domain-containing protein [Planctomycetota bacterium]